MCVEHDEIVFLTKYRINKGNCRFAVSGDETAAVDIHCNIPIYVDMPINLKLFVKFNQLSSLFLVHGSVSNWTEWSVSDAPCGISNATRRRYCNNPTPRYRGKDCTEHLIEYRPVDLPPCHRKYSIDII